MPGGRGVVFRGATYGLLAGVAPHGNRKGTSGFSIDVPQWARPLTGPGRRTFAPADLRGIFWHSSLQYRENHRKAGFIRRITRTARGG